MFTKKYKQKILITSVVIPQGYTINQTVHYLELAYGNNKDTKYFKQTLKVITQIKQNNYNF